MVFVPELHLKIQNWNEVEVINPLKEFLYYIIISAGGTWEEGWRPRPAEMIGRDYWWWGFIPYGHSAPVDEDLRLVNLFKAEGMIEGAQSDRDRPEGTKGNYWNRNILWKFSILSISSASAATVSRRAQHGGEREWSGWSGMTMTVQPLSPSVSLTRLVHQRFQGCSEAGEPDLVVEARR